MSGTYKTQSERTHDALLDRTLAAEARADIAERQAVESLELAHRAIDERDEALRDLTTLRLAVRASNDSQAAQGAVTHGNRRDAS